MPPQINGEKSHVRNAKKSSPFHQPRHFQRPKKLSPPTQINGEKVMLHSGTQKSSPHHSTSCAIFSLNWPPPLRKKRRKFLLVSTKTSQFLKKKEPKSINFTVFLENIRKKIKKFNKSTNQLNQILIKPIKEIQLFNFINKAKNRPKLPGKRVFLRISM